jgi:acetylornithine/N-succinyldiaminopimelate aminotransferase
MNLHSDKNDRDPAGENSDPTRGMPGDFTDRERGEARLPDTRRLFLRHIAQTSPAPLGLEIVRAEGLYLYDISGKRFIDGIGGISVCNTGHRHPRVVQAIRDQADQYLHLLVYGELIQSPQVQYAALLAANLPPSLNSVYFTNSGAEATEGAMKLAKRVTGRTEIVAFNQSYHGSTQGALSVMGDEYWRNAYRPLLPGIWHVDYNSAEALEAINDRTACVIAETVQAERGVYTPGADWLRQLRERCDATGALLVLDEIQAGFGRTGTLWGFQRYGVVPDILLLGKALGGGMPMGAFIADRPMMWALTGDPVLGHITTFGGHPVCCAAGLASLQVLLEEEWIGQVARKEKLWHQLLVHPSIRAVRSSGLLIAIEFDSFEQNKRIIDACIEKGLLTDWYLFAPQCMRIAPPLLITEEQIEEACSIILASIGEG